MRIIKLWISGIWELSVVWFGLCASHKVATLGSSSTVSLVPQKMREAWHECGIVVSFIETGDDKHCIFVVYIAPKVALVKQFSFTADYHCKL